MRLTGACTLAVLSCLPLAPRSASAQGTLGAALTFTKDATGLSVTAPSSGNIAPPGYYMVFIVNGTDVPSVAKIVKIY
jgi:galactose oxidase-like protein